MARLPNAMQNVANSVSRHSSRAANFVRNMADTIANAGGAEPVIIFGEHGFTIKYEKPNDPNGRVWDTTLYARGNVFYENAANPLEIKPSKGGETEIVSKEHVEAFIKTSAIREAFNAEYMANELLKKMLLAVIGLQALTIIVAAVT